MGGGTWPERHYDDYPSIRTSMFIIFVTIVDRCLKDSDYTKY